MFLFNIIIFVICIIVLILSSNKISYANNYVKVNLNIIRLFEESKIYNCFIFFFFFFFSGFKNIFKFFVILYSEFIQDKNIKCRFSY